MIIPSNVKCSFCPKQFCCCTCRQKHETHKHLLHVLELDKMNELKIEEQRIRSLCSICKGKKFALGEDQCLTDEVFQHVIKNHLPLTCNCCGKIFKTEKDFLDAGKCSTMECEPVNFIASVDDVANENKNCSFKKPNSITTLLDEQSDKLEKPDEIICEVSKTPDNINEDVLTPLTKINLRWRRKSKGFENATDNTGANRLVENCSSTLAPESPKKLVRQTSTPMQADLPNPSITNFTDSTYNSIQMSSINTDSTSSESDGGFSPQIFTKPPQITPIQEHPKKQLPLKSKPRSRIPGQATPLRQLMLSKSIQRAIAQHTAYPGLQQRKMCFDSTGSATDTSSTSNTSRNAPSSPLDLRTSPVIRRTKTDYSSRLYRKKLLEANARNSLHEILKSPNVISQQVNIQQVEINQIIIQKQQQHLNIESPSDSMINMTNTSSIQAYYSCCSSNITQNMEQTDDPTEPIDALTKFNSLPATPKLMGSGMLKKTISFESPFASIQEISHSQQDEEDDGEVFFSKETYSSEIHSHPVICRTASEGCVSTKCQLMQNEIPNKNTTSNLWSFVTSVVQMAAGRKEGEENEVQSGVGNRFSFPKSTIMQKAASFADFLKKQYTGDKHEPEPTTKRRRTYEKCAFVISPTSPIRKVRKIQGRKPIDRMRNSR